MKLLHTSDWHLGAADRDRSLYDDQKCFIDEICKIADENQIDAVLIAGDVYDRSVSSAEAISLYNYAMTRLCSELKKKVLIIAGNHDSAERLSTCSTLLEGAGLYVQGKLQRTPACVSVGDTDIYLLPWFTAEMAKSVYPEKADEIHSLTDAYKAVCDEIRGSYADGRKHMALSHAYIINSETSRSDRAAEIGTAESISGSVFDGFDYVALGHIHKPQDISDSIRYCGTPMPYSFGKEETQEKSVTVIDTETMEREIIPMNPLHKRITLSGTYDELLKGEYPEEIRNGYVRLEVTDIYVGYALSSELKNVYPNFVEISSREFESEDSSIHMTMDEFSRLESSPEEVFKSFCRECAGAEPDEHFLDMFNKAREDWEKEDEQ